MVWTCRWCSGPYEAKVVVVGPLPKEVAEAEPSFATGTTVAALDGDWTLNLDGKQVTTALKPWEELGPAAGAGPATYEKQFTAKATAKGQHVYLEIGDVHQYAKVTLNGKDLGDRAFQPYRWDVTSALKAGENDLKIEVRAPAVNRMGRLRQRRWRRRLRRRGWRLLRRLVRRVQVVRELERGGARAGLAAQVRVLVAVQELLRLPLWGRRLLRRRLRRRGCWER